MHAVESSPAHRLYRLLDQPIGANSAELDAMLGAAIAEVRSTWPDIQVDDAVFLQHLADTLRDADVVEIADIHLVDLFLCAACLAGDVAAREALVRLYTPDIEKALLRFGRLPTLVAESVQVTWERVIFGKTGRPVLAGYAGTGKLRTWLRICAAHTAMHALRGANQERVVDPSTFCEVMDVTENLELDYLRRVHTEQFNAALREAVRSLPARDRNLLRYAFVSNLNIEQIGAIYQVHRATVARWIVKIRADLFEKMKVHVLEQVSMNPSELQSVLDLVRSRLELDLPALVANTSTG